MVLLASQNNSATSASPLFNFYEHADIIFLAAFLGWMPAPMDVSVWHSVWSEENNRKNDQRLSLPKAMLDFKIGFFGTALLAMAFLFLGAMVMFGGGEAPSEKGTVFAAQLIDMYTHSLGDWAYPLIGIAALATMFSTTLTCFDAYPRTLEESYFIWRGKKNTTLARVQTKIYIEQYWQPLLSAPLPFSSLSKTSQAQWD